MSLVQDQDIFLVEPEKADLTITVIGTAEDDNTEHVTDIFISKSVCRGSRYLSRSSTKAMTPLRSLWVTRSSVAPVTRTVKMKARTAKVFSSC